VIAMASLSDANTRFHRPDVELADVILADSQEEIMDLPKPRSTRSAKGYETMGREETGALPEPGEAGGRHELRRTGQLRKPPTKMRVLLSKFDTYAVKTSSPRITGGIVTVLIWLVTMLYIAWTLYQWFTRPINIDNQIDWMMANGPFPLVVTCATRTGCYVSNRYMDPGMTGGVAANPDQEGCTFLPYEKNMTMDIVFSMNPEDGLAVLFDNEETDVKNFGIITTSTVNCEAFKPELPCTLDGVRYRNTRVSKGNNLANMVRIHNLTRSDAGRDRTEWFMLAIDSKVVTPDPDVSACVDTVNNLTTNGTYMQTRVIPNTNFVTSTVSRENNWSDLFGIVGGGYELFVAAGAVLLAVLTMTKDGECDIFGLFAATGDI